MAKIEDLIAQIPDERLRIGIAAEVKALKKTKKFGLVFEDHLPETVRLPRLPVKPGELVSLKREAGNQLWRVKTIHKNIATCDRAVMGYPATSESNKEFPISDLVVVRSFGDAIYPALVPVDRVERGGPDKPWHLLINADNFHALQLLLYSYEGKVDVIYIDPPYNTGARDWKYNNDYVDATDAWRHSKWLSMMKKRLQFAKRLLAHDGILITAIDDNEFSSLRMLLGELMPNYTHETVVVNHHPQGSGGDNVSATHEYAIVSVLKGKHIFLGDEVENETEEWSLLKAGAGRDYQREGRVKMFFAIHVDESGKAIGVGPELGLQDKYPTNKTPEGYRRVYPIDSKGKERRWRYGREKMEELVQAGMIVASLPKFTMKVVVSRKGANRPLYSNWVDARYNAGSHGSKLLESIFGDTRFSFPKSLYTVFDFIKGATRKRKGALVLDFFAGSGTTFHSVALLNALDQGSRRCILVTNNEVSERTAKELNEQNLFPGDKDFENQGIAERVTWPRCRVAIEGKRADGSELIGEYLNGREFSEGFSENAEFFRLDFLNPNEVARGDAFQAILPILWMMAGCRGKREESKGSQTWFFPKQAPFAVLIKEKEFRAFREALAERKDIEWIYLVTDSEENFGLMRRTLGRKFHCVQLYKSYLENFRINTPEVLGEGGAA